MVTSVVTNVLTNTGLELAMNFDRVHSKTTKSSGNIYPTTI